MLESFNARLRDELLDGEIFYWRATTTQSGRMPHLDTSHQHRRLTADSTSMALPVAMRAVATLTLLLAVVLPTAAQPLRPALKQAQCPVGYMQSGGYCMPLFRNVPPSTEKRGFVPRSPLIPRKAFPQSPYSPL